MINKIMSSSDKEFIDTIKSSTCIKEVLFKLGYTTSGNSWGYTKVKERMLILGLSSKDFKGRSTTVTTSTRVDSSKLFSSNSTHTRSVLRKRIIRDNLLEYKCAICGITTWNNKTLSLELDHINGINNDNRLENLRFLCPNCHSQTSTYGSKNSDIYVTNYKINDELKTLVLDSYNKLKSMKKVSKALQIKMCVVKEVMNELGLSRPNLRYVIRYNKDNQEIARYGSINEACNSIINNNELKTKKLHTCRTSFLRNCNKFWLNSYWKILDA